MTRILITGAAGSIGSELARQLSKKHIIYGLDINETGLFDIMNELKISGRVGDIRDENTVRDVFSDFKPEVVYHAAAYKHVSPMETVPFEAIRTNVIGLQNVLHYSRVYPVKKFVFISTDKAVNPKSVMGMTKLLGERMTKNLGKGYIVVRFGNVLGSRGSVIPIWQRQISANMPITVTDPKMTRYFMTIEEACSLVISASLKGNGGETMILDMGNPVNILDLAKEVLEKARSKYGFKIIGKRKGEALAEELMTEEEKSKAIKKDNFYIICE